MNLVSHTNVKTLVRLFCHVHTCETHLIKTACENHMKTEITSDVIKDDCCVRMIPRANSNGIHSFHSPNLSVKRCPRRYGPGRNVPQTLRYYLGECRHSQWTSSSLSDCLRTLTTWGWEIMVTVKRVPGSFATSVTRVHVSVLGLYNTKRLEVTVLVIWCCINNIDLNCETNFSIVCAPQWTH